MSEDKPRYDFHMHTFFSDGELIPMELIRRAFVHGNRSIAITDHVSFSNVREIVPAIARDCEQVDEWEITAMPGAEITHVPPSKIDAAVSLARKAGAKVIVVHGETPVEPVTPGTNRKAVENPDVDILAHPGYITADEAEIAKENGVFIEITCRQGHSLTNGHVCAIASSVGAKMLVNTDAHDCEDISTHFSARGVALGSGLSEIEADAVLVKNARELLKRTGF